MSITVYSKPACVQCTATTRAEWETLNGYGTGARTDWFPYGVDADFFCPDQTAYDAVAVEALIYYYELTKDPRIPPAIKSMLDWTWDYGWNKATIARTSGRRPCRTSVDTATPALARAKMGRTR